ncbi:MAG: NFACT RNA binding domain-containing protein [Deltaproteobacteria bacterium]|nr:NFACT RNA binding domain-containing protein [Deltaproteobacteria bacterium]
MSLSATEIALVVERLQVALEGAVVQNAISPEARDRVALELRTPGATHHLEIVLAAGFTRIGRIRARPKAASSPHPFVMLLRGCAVGLRVEAVRQHMGDRTVLVDLASGERRGTLVAELTSRHANLFWLDASGVVAGLFHPNRSERRALDPGCPYVAPLPHPVQERPSRFAPGADLEERIEAFYAQAESRHERDRVVATASRKLAAAGKRLDRLVAALEADLRRASEAERLGLMGQLLKANLRLAKKGMANLEVVDWEGHPATIALCPSLDPVTNMERLFDKARRLRKALPGIEKRLTAARTDRAAVAALAQELEHADDPAAVLGTAPAHLLGTAARPDANKRRQGERLPYRELAVERGRPAWVGRSAADNDALTVRLARPDDLWLHVRGMRGSHVVVPLGRGETPSADLLVDAALLAAHFSDARGAKDVEVTYTRRRYVQKPRGAPPGAVRLVKEKTIYLKVDEERLARLLTGVGRAE